MTLLEGLVDGSHQYIGLERLRRKVERVGFHRLHGHRDVAVAGDEDDRNIGPAGEPPLQLEAAESLEFHIEHEAAGNCRARP